ncbi:50S ribosomal protein L25 [Paenibacillus arenosi]|uniref:Large ribosomal subunit protein bL25 n=1 Tax=Paenibacillus arenosi TaxID=2774142 RepID=A0ABR9ATR5_9BACL|nr:50S ribosomal protein L25 [Paenibacillus arenosi]MBD8497504.1 50S ribosomal protein L25 [Paenibacillus arenosi]
MMSTTSTSFQLKAESRKVEGGSTSKRLRKQGRLPAVVYGQGIDSISLSVDAREIINYVRSKGLTDVVHLVVDGKKPIPVMIKDVQRQDEKWQHVDLIKVDKNKPIKVRVPLEYIGIAPGTKSGGILDIQETSVEVEGLPDHIPASIEIDVSSLDISEKLLVKDVSWPKEVSLFTQEDIILASVVLPSTLEANDEASSQDTAQETDVTT